MRYLQNLLSTRAPSPAALLDTALILSVIPHLFVLKSLMILYIIIALGFILKKTPAKQDSYLLLAIGLLLIGISFFNNYNFSDFSRMQFFVSLISSLLILAATLQRATRETNFYLKISPALLMLLSFFFFNSILMLFYSLATLFCFTLLLIWSRMPTQFIDVFKVSTGLFVLSLPAVIVMFIAFPRISFEKADYGFRADSYADEGYGGKMDVSDKAFSPSKRVVMEVFFKDADIKEYQLYFRGSTLYGTDPLAWSENTLAMKKEIFSEASDMFTYDITLYPHAKNYVYALDMPLRIPQKTTLLYDRTVASERPIYEKKRFTFTSALSYRLHSRELTGALDIEKLKGPRTAEALRHIKETDADDATKAAMLFTFFKALDLSYTTKPKNLAMENFLDSFLFEAKNGYCVHFASAFASSAKLIGIPARVVTGYKGSLKNKVENYLLITSADAHSWVELYLDSKGWVRFEPTATAARNLDILDQDTDKMQKNVFEKINLGFMYVKYLISNWILEYNRLKQMDILKNLLNDTIYLLKFILSLTALVALSLLLFGMLKYSKKKDKTMRTMRKLLQILHKKGLVKEHDEAMDIFLRRAQTKLGISLEEINTLYQTLKYAKTKQPQHIHELHKAIEKVKRAISYKTSP